MLWASFTLHLAEFCEPAGIRFKMDNFHIDIAHHNYKIRLHRAYQYHDDNFSCHLMIMDMAKNFKNKAEMLSWFCDFPGP